MLHTVFAEHLGDFNINDQPLADLTDELTKNLDQLFLGIVVGADVQHQSVFRMISQQTLVALIGLENKVIAPAAIVISGQIMTAERIDQAAGQERGIAARIVKRFSQPGSNGGLAAAAGDRDHLLTVQSHRLSQSFGTMQPGNILTGGKVRVVFFNRRRVNQEIRLGFGHAGTVLGIKQNSLFAQSIKDPLIFRIVQRPVTAGHPASERAAHLRQTTHADTTDTNKMHAGIKFQVR